MNRISSSRGFTLLETIIALAILSLALMAIFDMNSGAVAMHAYTKRLTVATLLARSKMTDIEQELFDKGFQADDDEQDGDFSEEGWPSFHWRAKVIAPKTDGVPPEQLITAVFNLPLDATGGGGLDKAMSSAGAAKLQKAMQDFGGGQLPPGMQMGGAGAGGLAALLGPMAGFATQQLGQMVTQITQSVREVHLTVSWKDGKNVESIDVVTHVVSLGQGSDRNGASGPGGTTANGLPPAGWTNPKTQQPAVAPAPCRNDPTKMCEGGDPEQQLVPAQLPPQNGALNGLNPAQINDGRINGFLGGGLGKPNFGPRPPPGRIGQ